MYTYLHYINTCSKGNEDPSQELVMFCQKTGLSIIVIIIVKIAGTWRGVGHSENTDIFSFNQNKVCRLSEPSDNKIVHESRVTRKQKSLR
jgi:hypothetical protein